MKKCGRCGETKELTEFGKSKQTKDGLRCYCKACKRAESAAWRKKNKDYGKTYREQHKEKLNKYSRDYHQANKEELN